MSHASPPPFSPFISSTLQAALTASAQGDTPLALSLFAQAAEAEPASGMPHFLMGAEYAALGQLDAAEAAFANAVLLAPGFAIARYQLGLLQFSSARAATALLTWQPLLDLPDESALPHWVRGFAALAQDAFEPARQHFEAGLARNHDNPPMSADIRQVLNGMDAALATSAASASAPAMAHAMTHAGDQAREEDLHHSEEAEASHFLLSNYRQQGPAH